MRPHPNTPATLAVVAILALAACRPERTERELLVEATLLQTAGDAAAAREAFDRALQAAPDSAEILIRYADFLAQQHDVPLAESLVARARALELTAADRRRLDATRATLLQLQIDALRQTPRPDPDALLTALTELASVAPDSDAAEQTADLLVCEARRRLACGDCQQPCPADTLANTRLDGPQAAIARSWTQRALDFGATSGAVTGPERDELARIAERLDRLVFDASFDARFADRIAPRLLARGHWNPATRTFALPYLGPLPAGVTAQSPPDVLVAAAQTVGAREQVTDLVYELAERPRNDEAPLPFAAAEFVRVTATDLAVAPDGRVAWTATVPYDLVKAGAWLLHLRHPPDEGSGSTAPTDP